MKQFTSNSGLLLLAPFFLITSDLVLSKTSQSGPKAVSGTKSVVLNSNVNQNRFKNFSPYSLGGTK